MNIAQDLCVRFASDQFSCLLQVMRHPEMHSLVHFHSLGEFPCEGQVSGMTRCREKCSNFRRFSSFSALFGGFRAPSGVFWPMMVTRFLTEPSAARGLYESSRAVTQVDGLPRAPSGDNYM